MLLPVERRGPGIPLPTRAGGAAGASLGRWSPPRSTTPAKSRAAPRLAPRPAAATPATGARSSSPSFRSLRPGSAPARAHETAFGSPAGGAERALFPASSPFGVRFLSPEPGQRRALRVGIKKRAGGEQAPGQPRPSGGGRNRNGGVRDAGPWRRSHPQPRWARPVLSAPSGWREGPRQL